MKKLIRAFLTSAVIATICQPALWAAGITAPNRASKNLSPVKPEPSLVTQVKSQKMEKSITRATLVNTLLADQRTRAIIKSEASKAGVNESGLSGIASKAIFKPNNTAADQLGYAMLDWDKGLTFSLTTVPTYGAGKYHAGDLIVKGAEYSSENNIAVYSLPQKDYGIRRICTFYLDLPLQPATYMIAFRLTDKNGQSPKEWVTLLDDAPYMECICYKTGKQLNYEMWYYDQDMQLIPMKDSTGFAGIFSVSPLDHTIYSSPTMRSQNYWIDLEVNYINGLIPKSMETIALKDITVMRL